MDQKDLKQIGELLDSKLDSKFADYDKKMDSKFAAYDKKMDSKFSAQDKKINVDIDTKLDKRIGELEQKMFEWKSEIVDNSRRIDKLEKKVFGVVVSGV